MITKLFKKFTSVSLIIAFISFFLVNFSTASEIKEITIPGTGDYQVMMRIIARTFEQKHPAYKIHVPDSVGSSGGIKKVLSGQARLARTARPLKDHEAKAGLTVEKFAYSPVVLVVNPYIKSLKNLTTSQLLSIYKGEISNWKTLDKNINLDTIYPITREKGDSSLIVLSKYLAQFADVNSKIAKIKYSTPDTVQTILHYKQTIGFLPMSAALGTELNILKINGVFPSMDNVSSNKYKFLSPFSIVYKEELEDYEQNFIDFLFSPSAVKIILEHGCIPISR